MLEPPTINELEEMLPSAMDPAPPQDFGYQPSDGGGDPYSPPSVPTQEPTPSAMPTPDVLEQFRQQNENMLKLMERLAPPKEEQAPNIPTITLPELTEDDFDQVVTSREAMNDYLRKFAQANQAIAMQQSMMGMMQALPELIAPLIDQRSQIMTAVNTFWTENPHLVGREAEVQRAAQVIEGINPSLTPTQVLAEVARYFSASQGQRSPSNGAATYPQLAAARPNLPGVPRGGAPRTPNVSSLQQELDSL